MRKFLIILIAVILAVFAGIFYLNQAASSAKIKAAIVNNLQTATGKKVLLGSVRFDIFKGLVLKDLIIRDDINAIVNVRKARCSFLIMPFFNKEIVISRLILESPDIFIERGKDNSINILELFSKERAAAADFKMFIRRVSVRKATVIFYDLALEPLYAREIKGLDAEIYLLLPGKVKYNVKFDIPSDSPIKIGSSGEYSISAKELAAEIRIKDFTPKEFIRYYENTGFSFPEGKFDSIINLQYKGDTLFIDTESETKGIALSKDKLSVRMSGSERSNLRYNFADKKFNYTGNVNIQDMAISGVGYVERIDNIKGRIEFSNLGLSSDNMTATVLGLPMEAKISVKNFNSAVLNIEASSDIKLAPFQDILKERFGLAIPAGFSGDAKLRLAAQYPVSAPEQCQIKGSIYMLNASMKVNRGRELLENVTGRFRFVPNQVSWDEIGFRYRDIHYSSSGTLTDFKTPGIQLKLASKDISLDTVFAINEKALVFSKFSGKYLNSGFSLSGALDSSDPARLDADMSGVMTVNLEDLKRPLEKFKEKFERVKPKGVVRAEFSLKGDLKDLKACAIDANFSSEGLSLYGFKLENSTINYGQKNGAGNILFMRSFLYGGSMSATGKIDWVAKEVPYQLDMDIDGIKIEKFKMDTAFKDKDIAGFVKVHSRIKGFFNDINKLSGEGKIAVTEGKLWQLDLFRGLGVLLFTSDFNNIMFREGHCDFNIGDRSIYTDEITLKSELLDLYGPVKIGFDTSVDATIKAELSDDALESGARQNIAAALGKYTLIKVTGTLKEPKYKMRPDVGNIVESIAEQFSGE